ncbi:amino acid transporter [Halalkaliarchaeum desulfuricum]|uniref:Amino acid transporter n=1 Tax=Halalkaliarchaeum desulfuricum TaxID=2055893 RepID=A0A343TLT3_9EURY|nr:APC family permease [Halalkaliarchaeum desulfuricum]AUX10055.1 amino acid transporter [Halalkaliarchaeum desulfuricum]
MPTGLKRDLGLGETFAIAVGAMIGSGIFILPGIAWVFADAAAVLAFVLAAVLVMPAALAVAEMSTAIPEDGGPYLYVERSMGPLLGTIAGAGTWLMLSLKSALALVGGVPYLVYASPTLGEFVIHLAVGLAIVFTVVNLVSAEGSGKLQFVIVVVLLAILGWLIFGSLPEIDPGRTVGAFDPTTAGILPATAIVFISYAGLTKIGAVAEEVKEPGRNLPLAIVGALVFVTIAYATIVYVTIGVLDVSAAIAAEGPASLSADGEGPIIALAAEAAIGDVAALAIVVAAIMALASTANAGLLAASRFPLAMARDGIAPPSLETVSEQFATPINAVALTGGVLLVMVTVFPIQRVAEFGSAFQILVFVLLNVALVGFREGAAGPGYDPAFETPMYPWMPIFGILGGVLVLSYMSPVAILGAVGIAALSGLWYVGYVRYYRGGLDRESAARAGVREGVSERAVARTRELFEATEQYDVLVGITEQTSNRAKRDMVGIASDLGRIRSTTVSVVEFVDVPHHVFPTHHSDVVSGERPDWLDDVGGTDRKWALNGSTNTGLEYRKVDTEDHKEAIVDYVKFTGTDLLFIERRAEEGFRWLFGDRETEWILKNTPSAVAVVEDRGFDSIEEISVVTTRGTYDPFKLLIADAIAEETGAEIDLLRALPADVAESRRERVEQYHSELLRICTVPGRSTVLETDDTIGDLARFIGDADLLVTTAGRTGSAARLFGQPESQLIEAVDCSAIGVQADEARHRGLVERIVMEHLF